ncbi:MAG: hypothetical protein FWE47_03290 [Oscillospiraceae bacterium]|nr:hypothetical protein [Oscillospiraceae bacterium]
MDDFMKQLEAFVTKLEEDQAYCREVAKRELASNDIIAVERLDPSIKENQDTLKWIVENSWVGMKVSDAIKRITDQEYLRERLKDTSKRLAYNRYELVIAMNSEDYENQEYFKYLADNDESLEVCAYSLRKITDQAFLQDRAINGKHPGLQTAANQGIFNLGSEDNREPYEWLVINGTDYKVFEKAIKNVSQEFLCKYAKSAPPKINDLNYWEYIKRILAYSSIETSLIDDEIKSNKAIVDRNYTITACALTALKGDWKYKEEFEELLKIENVDDIIWETLAEKSEDPYIQQKSKEMLSVRGKINNLDSQNPVAPEIEKVKL